MPAYSIEEELAFLFDQSKADTFALVKAHEIHQAMWAGKFYGVNFFPQYVDSFGNASFYGFLADLEPSYALSLANRTNRHFGVDSVDQATAIEELTRAVRQGETPKTSKALRQLDESLAPYLLQWEKARAEQDELTARAQPRGKVTIYRNAGRPTIYPDRRRTTVELTYELFDVLDALRGSIGLGTYIEEILRRDPKIAAELAKINERKSHEQ